MHTTMETRRNHTGTMYNFDTAIADTAANVLKLKSWKSQGTPALTTTQSTQSSTASKATTDLRCRTVFFSK